MYVTHEVETPWREPHAFAHEAHATVLWTYVAPMAVTSIHFCSCQIRQNSFGPIVMRKSVAGRQGRPGRILLYMYYIQLLDPSTAVVPIGTHEVLYYR